MKGEVKKIGRNSGTILGEDKQQYGFDSDSLTRGLTLRDIAELAWMEFRVERQKNGRARAVDCRIIDWVDIQFFKGYVLNMDQKKELYDEFCDHVESYAGRLKKGKVTTSMIRKIYARVLNARTVTEIKQLRPHFAYTAGRNEKLYVLREFMDLLDYLAKSMEYDSQQQLENYKQFMEAIVAYRKYVGNDQ